ncbi:ATPase [Brenneria goodwinii]|uniref:ATPase n=1 Tax=Brenneria goodwinii TaxID=1109412 RepID=UPI000EF26177|nr:ATPase [Brenneria goodwinii]MCG8159164.1 ATPase [Brenneria goodwinii]MCG8163757.1 ATPase [Brenneria goodwinii]MCG8168395.1 ATPase [Brenneria goodwinii]MCG8171241.1 ATPase [Brenneria goodwinii]MCG8177665.1 ATPase [Brenneria goodwinii]
MSAKPAAQSQLDKKENNVTQVEHASTNLFYQPETGNLICVKPEASAEFEKEWRQMMKLVDDQAKSSEVYSAMLQLYGEKYKQNSEFSDLGELEKQVTEAEEKMLADKKALQEKLGEFSASDAGYEDVVELIPVMSRKRRRGEGGGKHYVYVKKGYFDKLKNGKKTESYNLHTVSNKSADKKSGDKSIITTSSNGKRHYDLGKLAKQMVDLDKKMEFLSKDDIVKIEGTLTDFASAWNESLLLPTKEYGGNIDVSAAAQFLRYTSNVSSKGEFDPSKGSVSYKGEASAVLSIAEGVAEGKFYFPDRLGWPLKWQSKENGSTGNKNATMGNTSADIIDMGQLRLFISCELSGFIGGSAQAEAQIQVVACKKDGVIRQTIAGIRDNNPTPFSQRRSGRSFYQQMDADDEGVEANVELFGGARAGLTFNGGVEWLEPKRSAEFHGADKEGLKAAAEFVTFCTLSPEVQAMAGLGAGAQFKCTFINGKFCFKIAASLCCGLGAKGAFKGEVGYQNLLHFTSWLAYQLYSIDYHKLDLITEEGFKAFTQFCVMSVMEPMEKLYEISINKAKATIAIVKEYEDMLLTCLGNISNQYEASQERNALAERIHNMEQEMLGFTPEAKGVLLYLLTRHGKMDKLDYDNYGDGFIPDVNNKRKSAIIKILQSIQTRREWDMTLCSMNRKGEPSGNVEDKEAELRRYLQLGLNRDKDMDTQKAEIDSQERLTNSLESFSSDMAAIMGNNAHLPDEYNIDAIRDGLKLSPTFGYALAMNNTYDYRLYDRPNPHYPRSGMFGPLSPESDNRSMYS